MVEGNSNTPKQEVAMQGAMQVMNHLGHTTQEWDTEVHTGPLDPRVVEKEFNRLVRQGHMAIATKGGEQELIRRFDPEAENIKVTIPLQGG